MTIAGAKDRSAPRFDDASRSYDALLLLSFGGPERPEDVMPFLENVTRGRNVPRERLEEVAEHYLHFGGVSPINAQNRALISALEADLIRTGIDLPIYFGNRNWHPLLTDTIGVMRESGVSRVLVFVTSAFSSWSGCRQYREDVLRSVEALGSDSMTFDKIRVFYNHPGFILPMIEAVRTSLNRIPAASRADTRVVFTAHSIPSEMAAQSAYEAQLLDAARLIATALELPNWQLAYQSRSGAPHVPWLQPDILDVITDFHQQDVRDLVVVPLGFVSDHMEVLFDLDHEAKDHANALGMRLERAATVGTHPDFVAMIRDLIIERMTESPVRPALGFRGPNHDICPIGCCLLRAPESGRKSG